MGLNKEMQNLIDNIKQASIFYLPRSLFENANQKDLRSLEDVGFFNSLFVNNTKGKIKLVSDGFQYKQVLKKSRILKSNVFELLELRAKLDKNAFHYLIDDYFKELNNWVVITNIVRKNAKTEANNYKTFIQSYLELQYETFKTHQEELESHFGEWKAWFQAERIFKLSPYDLDKSEYKNNTTSSTIRKGNKKVNQIKTKSITKKIIINKADVDKHLLESIFSVNFSKIRK